MKQELQSQLLEALEKSGAEAALCQIVLAWKASGMSQQAVYEAFEECRKTLRALDEERKEDIIMDAMDYIVGWCSPPLRLF